MEDKTYGIKTHLIEEFKQFQISRQKAAIAFIGNCTLFISALPMRTSVVAANGVISINPFPLFEGGLTGFRIPPQRLELIVGNLVVIALHPSLKIQLIFDSADQKLEFLGKRNLAEESSGDDSASAPSSSSTSATVDSTITKNSNKKIL